MRLHIVALAWLALRAQLRQRWRAMAGLALLLGLAGGVVLTAAAGAWRTGTAYPRLLSWANAAQVQVAPGGPDPAYLISLARLPQVAAVAPEAQYTLVLPVAHGAPDFQLQAWSSPGGSYGQSVDRVKLTAGAMFSGGAADEAVALAIFAALAGLIALAVAGQLLARQLALGALTMRAVHARLGEDVQVAVDFSTGVAGPEQAHVMRVVGEAVFPDFGLPALSDTDLGSGAVVAASLLSEGGQSQTCPARITCYDSFLLRYRPGTDAAAAAATLLASAAKADCPPGACTVTTGQQPGDIQDYAAVRDTPLLLGAVLAVLAVGTLTHVLATGVQRRRRDLAVLKALGLTRAQLRGVVAWEATALAGAALLVGVPAGIVAGRLAWAAFATEAGVATGATFDLALLLLTIPATLLVANVIAAWPGRAAARLRPAIVLRTE